MAEQSDLALWTRRQMDSAVAIISGGMDSAALAYMLKEQYAELRLVSFDYGQRHRKELTYARRIAEHLQAIDRGAYVRHDVVNLRGVTAFLKGSALTDNVVVPDGHYSEPSASITVVPNRNMIMLSVATAIGVAEECDCVYTGVHAGDHYVYPDCRPEFLHFANLAAVSGNEGFARPTFRIEAPFLHMEKSEIVKVGEKYRTPWADTWSCYKGGSRHCGTCPTCVERQEAFWVAEVRDPTNYSDKEYWKTVTKIAGVR